LVALGATAVRSLSGRPLPISKIRGRVTQLADGSRMLATIHPSYILRIKDETDKRAQYRRFVADLRICAKMLSTSRLSKAAQDRNVVAVADVS
jgi:DNA polymerase